MSHLLLISDQHVVHESNMDIIFPQVPGLDTFSGVYSVEAALKEETVPTLILLEFRLKAEKFGPEYIPMLREKFPNAKIVGYSMDPSSWTMFQEFGADGFIYKAWEFANLVREIGSFLS